MFNLTSVRRASLALIPVLILSSDLCAQGSATSIVAPPAASTSEITRLAQDYQRLYWQKNADAAGGLVRDRAAYAKWVELRWILSRTLDEKGTLGDLSEIGFTAQDNGSYSVSLDENPYWTSEVQYLMSLREGISERVSADLKLRGFSADDLARIASYISTNHPDGTAVRPNAQMTEQFATEVRARYRRHEAVSAAEVMNFIYQRSLRLEEAHRAWVVGLLDTLDEAKQRALIEYVTAQGGFMVLGPASDTHRLQQELLGMFVSGQYSGALEQEARSIQK